MIRRLCAQVVFQRNLLMAIMVLMLLPLCSRADCIAQQVTAEMAGSVNTTNLQLLMLEDPGRKLDVATVAGLPVDEFSLGNGTVTSSMKGGYLWLRLCLQSGAEAPDEWLLTLLPPYLNSIATYHFSDGG